MKTLIIALLVLPHLCSTCHAMEQDTSRVYDLVFEKQIRFSLSPIVFNKLNIQHEQEVLLHSRNTVSWDAGVQYYQSITHNLGFSIGGFWSMAPYNLKYYFYGEMPHQEGPRLRELNHFEYFIHLLSLKGGLQKIHRISARKYISVEAGASIVRVHPFEITGSVGYNTVWPESLRLFMHQLANLSDKYPRRLLAYHLKTGAVFTTAKTNSIGLNIVANYSPRMIGGGAYEFSNLPYESYGYTELGINYLGVEFTYGLTLAKRPYFRKLPVD